MNKECLFAKTELESGLQQKCDKRASSLEASWNTKHTKAMDKQALELQNKCDSTNK